MKIITKENIQNKKVIIRLDLDVPLNEQNKVKDTTRLLAVLPTLQLLNKNAAQIIMIGHLGRPDGKIVPEMSLKPVCDELSALLGEKITLYENITATIENPNQITTKYAMLENLRFDSREETNNPIFAQQIASLGEIFIFEAFAVSHRKTASTVGVAQYLPSYAGLRVAKEVENLSNVLNHPDHPLLVIIGGAKIETKLPLINNMLTKADYIFVAGKLPHEIQEKNITLPQKVIIAEMNKTGKDIAPAMHPIITDLIHKSAMVIWNGPVGKFEDENEREGTRTVAQALATTQARSIIGGGETNEAVAMFEVADKITFISVGGGAMLEYLAGKTLPALQILE